jgi:hypothetical protein
MDLALEFGWSDHVISAPVLKSSATCGDHLRPTDADQSGEIIKLAQQRILLAYSTHLPWNSAPSAVCMGLLL